MAKGTLQYASYRLVKGMMEGEFPISDRTALGILTRWSHDRYSSGEIAQAYIIAQAEYNNKKDNQ